MIYRKYVKTNVKARIFTYRKKMTASVYNKLRHTIGQMVIKQLQEYYIREGIPGYKFFNVPGYGPHWTNYPGKPPAEMHYKDQAIIDSFAYSTYKLPDGYFSLIVKNTAPHAAFQEFGTARTGWGEGIKPRPFLYPGMLSIAEDTTSALANAIKAVHRGRRK